LLYSTLHMTTKLRSFSPSTWIVDAPQKVAAMQFGTRSTIVRLPSKGLAIISPIDFDDQIAQEIDALGQVDFIIAPNLFHHLYFNDAAKRWPTAKALLPPSLKEKVPD